MATVWAATVEELPPASESQFSVFHQLMDRRSELEIQQKDIFWMGNNM